MNRIFSLLLVGALFGGSALAADAAPPPPPATPAVPDPADLTKPAGMIRDLYQRYYDALTQNDKDQKPLPPEFEWEAIADKYFTPELATRFKKALKSEEPVIDWDFFVNGQDYVDLKIISVDAATIDAKTSNVTIVTSNFGNSSTTIVSMVDAGKGWKIADFTFTDAADEGMSLSGVLKDAGY